MRIVLLALMCGLFVGAPPLFVACSPSSMEPRGSIDQVDQRVAIGFASARTALALLDAAEVLYLEEGTRKQLFHGEDDPLLAASGRRIAALQTMRSTLERLRFHLTRANPSDLREIFSGLAGVAEDARQAGIRVPSEVSQTLTLLEQVAQ